MQPRSPVTVLLPIEIFLTVLFCILFSPIQLLQGLGLNLPAGAGTDQHTGSAIAVYLVLHGANVTFYNHEGKTPLDLCQDTQTAALIQQVARNAPRWVACVAGCCKQYGLRKEPGARGGGTLGESPLARTVHFCSHITYKRKIRGGEIRIYSLSLH